MLYVTVPETELYDEVNEEFITLKPVTLKMEHSLLSISKWEALHHKAFLTGKKHTEDETIDYIKCMTIGDVDDSVYDRLTTENLRDILDYVDSSKTATYVPRDRIEGKTAETTTSEVLYYDMFTCGIPIECERWHLSKLLALIHVFSVKNKPAGKRTMSNRELARRNSALNAARRKKYNSKG